MSHMIMNTSPCTIKQSEILLDISKLSKTKSHPIAKKNYKIKKHYSKCSYIFADGSKDIKKTGFADVFNKNNC